MYRLYMKNLADENNGIIDFKRSKPVPYELSDIPLESSSVIPPAFQFTVPRIGQMLYRGTTSVVVGSMSLFQRTHVLVPFREQEVYTASVFTEQPGEEPVKAAYRFVSGKDIIASKEQRSVKDAEKVQARVDTNVLDQWLPDIHIPKQGHAYASSILQVLHSTEDMAEELPLDGEDVATEIRIETRDVKHPSGERVLEPDPVAVKIKNNAVKEIGLFAGGKGRVEEFSVASVAKDVPKVSGGVLKRTKEDTMRFITAEREAVVADIVTELSRPEIMQLIAPFFKRPNDRPGSDDVLVRGVDLDDRTRIDSGIDEVNNSGDQQNNGTGGDL